MVNYGSTFKPARLSSNDVGRIPNNEKETHWGLIRGIVIIAEIVAAVAVEAIFPAAAPLASGVAGLGFGGANYAVDRAENNGQVFLPQYLLDFGLPFATGFTALRRSAKMAESLPQNIKLLERIAETADEIKDIEKIGTLRYSKYTTTRRSIKQQLKHLELDGFKDIEALSKSLTRTNTANVRVKNLWKKKLDMEHTFQKIERRFTTAQQKETWRALIRATEHLTIAESQPLMKSFMSSLSMAEKKTIFEEFGNLGGLLKSYKNIERDEALKQGKRGTLTRIVKATGSQKFNDRYVQTAQLIDPNDLGRFGPERAYQFLKKHIDIAMDKWFIATEKQITRNMIKAAKYGYKGQKQYEKLGGTWIRSSVVLGYRMINDMGLKKLVLIEFRPEAFDHIKDPTSKNFGGKKPVLVHATNMQLKAFREGGMRYYLETWAQNMGGREAYAFFTKQMGALNMFLGFIPIQSLRNLMSIVSNWVENVDDMVSGEYKKKYKTRLRNSFLRASLNRTARLVSRVIVGGTIRRSLELTGSFRAAEVGKLLQREIQRSTMIVVKAFETADKDGKFVLTSKPKSARGDSVGTKIKKGFLSQSLKPITTQLRRSTRRRGFTMANNVLSTDRNLRIARRTVSAATPNRVFNNRSWKMKQKK